jgi:hypothetical protein
MLWLDTDTVIFIIKSPQMQCDPEQIFELKRRDIAEFL